MADGYRGSSPSWFRTVKSSRDAREKVKTLANAISEGKRPPHDDEEEEQEKLEKAKDEQLQPAAVTASSRR